MKLFVKIFILTAGLISAALGLSGYMMITSSFNNALDRETEIALNQYRTDRATFRTVMVRGGGYIVSAGVAGGTITISTEAGFGGSLSVTDEELSEYITIRGLEERRISSLLNADGKAVFNNSPDITLDLSEDFSENTIMQSYREINGNYYIVTESDFFIGREKYFFISATSIDEIMRQKSEMMINFSGIYFVTMVISFAFIMVFTSILTRPITKLTATSKRIADGGYGERIKRVGKDEIGVLSNNFNKMAEAIEAKIAELSLGIKQKEDFMASFAHELKTPLTSVIGYADMIYQKELPHGELKKSAFYIYSEGMRLESLSLKLLDLIILDKRDFIFEETNAAELIENSVGTVMPKADDLGVEITTDADAAMVEAEGDLIRTLLLNLLDNGVKSGGNLVTINGRDEGDYYRFTVSDNGRGIPESELPRIKEAFYMVDKSRARKQHGAGLGLALAEKIATIHGSTLEFESESGKGTRAMFSLKKYVRGGGGYDD